MHLLIKKPGFRSAFIHKTGCMPSAILPYATKVLKASEPVKEIFSIRI